MPFWDGERFHLFYLLDRDHHAEQGGLGGHQWAHAATLDLVDWEHYPLALPIGEPGSVDQHGICTGSIFEYDGVYHAFYATRLKAADGSVSEVVCRAVSRDLVHFEKDSANPMFGAPPGYDKGNHRDPFVFQHAETGLFYMLVTASRDGRGVLAHYTSDDLDHWDLQEPFWVGTDGHSPECPEHFFWNGWWYLVYSHNAQMEYKISRHPLGPWQSAGGETIEPSTLRVPRTAEFKNGRRLAVGFLPWRQGSRDAGEYVYAGSVVFREVLQDSDGTLTTQFVPEMLPTEGVQSFRLIPDVGATEYGVMLRADEDLKAGYRLSFHPQEGRVTLQAWPAVEDHPTATLAEIAGLDQPVEVIVCQQGSVIDVCLNERYTLIERGFDSPGTMFGAWGATVENTL